MEHFGGIAIVMVAGLFNASFAIPMRYNHKWKWENTWLAFSVWSLLILPWFLVALLITHVGEIFRSLTFLDMTPALLCGFLWGITQATLGVSIDLLGVSVVLPVVSGIAIVIGAFTPVVAQHPQALAGRLGLLLVVSCAFLIAGLVVYARAAQVRERTSATKKSTLGLLLAIFSGVVGGAMNIGFALSGRIVQRSEVLGNGPQSSTYLVWAVLLTAGFIPNLLYCLYLIRKNQTGSLFISGGPLLEFLRSTSMAVLWILATTLYGVSTTYMGKFGTSIGYVLYGSFTILFANILGWKAGEWVGSSRESQRWFWVGMGLILGSVATLGFKLG